MTKACMLLIALLGFVLLASDSGAAQLTDTSGGKVWVDPTNKLRIRLSGDASKGWDVNFEAREEDDWQPVAAFPPGRVWTVYSTWNTPPDANSAQWYGGQHEFRALDITASEQGDLVLKGHGDVAGQPWEFEDRYSFEYGTIKVVRRWHHASQQKQSVITLLTAVRVPVGEDPRILLPGILYNGNPGAYPTKPVYKLPYVPDAKALYEEHRFPVPFVNLESSVSGKRLYASLLTIPSKVPQAHKGDDQWWSLGLEWQWDGHVDLLIASGAVMTNGMPSMVYGHRNSFDPYRDAYIDVAGDITFEKVFYLDCGVNSRRGYAFRGAVWKAFEIFQPIHTPHLGLGEAMDLKAKRVSQAYLEQPGGVAGIPVVSQYRRFIYGWAGDNLATAYGLLYYGERAHFSTKGDEHRQLFCGPLPQRYSWTALRGL